MIPTPHKVAALRAAWRAANNLESGRPCWRWVNTADGPPRLTVFDVIGGWDSDAAEFVRTVQGLDADEIHVHINSPGGFVYDAVSMYEALLAHPAAIAVHVDGLAASAASFLVQAGTTRDISSAGRMMIHDAHVVAFGSPADLREAADLGDAMSDDIAGIYAARAGGRPATWRTAMTAETWYSAATAAEAGLVDTVRKASAKTTATAESRASQLIRARARVQRGQR